MPVSAPYKKKLIEVALPLPEINDASAYDKMPGIGPHPKGIHHWWARLPLPTARAVLFASVVDDPEAHPEIWPTEELQNAERERLFGVVRRMMTKKLSESPEVYAEATTEMLRHSGGRLPAVYDPFAGGGSIPLEANRLGFETHSGDLNPVAVLLNKCNLELAPHWIDHPPVNPEDRGNIGGSENWRHTHGLAADVRFYGRLIRERAQTRIGHLYPSVKLPQQQGGGEANVIGWIWARTVASPDPAAKGKHVPLVSSYFLSSKKNKPAWLHPVVDKAAGTYDFEVRTGTPTDPPSISAGTKVGKGGFRCLLTGSPITFEYVRTEAQANRLGSRMLAVVAESRRGRTYLNASNEQENIAESAKPSCYPDSDLPLEALGFRIQNYGFRKHWQMFTPRQLTAMVELSDLVKGITKDVLGHASASGLPAADAQAYARTVTIFLALALDRCADFNNSFCRWKPSGEQLMQLFGRGAIPMVWDFAESNIMGERGVCWHTAVGICADAIETLIVDNEKAGSARQVDAATGANGIGNLLISTDPPYYDNIGYAALSDFFYIWLRRTVGDFYPELFSTLLVPKIPELTASPELFDGDQEKAKQHFETGFRSAFTSLREKMDHRFPLTVYYAFRQEDEESSGTEDDGTSAVDLTTGWETLLDALISSRFQITATWPVRASQKWRMRAMGSNALASYIVLACRPRPTDAQRISSTQFRQELKTALPPALRHLQQGNVAPVDFAQAALGPGMAIYSRYGSILESTGKELTVRAALGMINQIQAEVLTAQEDDFDPETRWAIAWFELNGFADGGFGDAEVLTKAKTTTVSSLDHAGLVLSGGGTVRLLRPEQLPTDWDPAAGRLTVWGMTHHLLRVYYHQKAGDEATANLLRKFGSKGDLARDLALRLFRISEKKGLLVEAQAYNALGLGWSELAHMAKKDAVSAPQQARLI
jgi:putative DNA methylase